MELVLRGATIIDGTGAPSFAGDVLVSGDRIAAIVPPGVLAGHDAEAIDCTGLIIAPGFINIHSHSDISIFEEPTAMNYVAQGVTLILSGNCGSSAAPWSRDQPEVAALLESDPDLKAIVTWSSFAEYLEVLERLPKTINLAGLVGHGNVRASVLGMGRRTASEPDLELMRGYVREAMEAGAFGLSTGLIYVPGVFSDQHEVVELAKAAAQHGGLYATHLRNEADRLLDAVTEAIRIGQASGARVQISHHKCAGRQNWGLVRTALELEEYYRRQGVEVTCDVYPCTAGATGLVAVFPNWAFAEGREAFLKLVRDEAGRARLKRDMTRPSTTWENMYANTGPSGLVISYTKVYPQYLGMSVADIAAERGADPIDTALDLIGEDPECGIIVHSMTEGDVRHVLAHRLSMVCDDGSVVKLGEGAPHPRTYRAFTRALATYARDERVLTLEQAIHKMTGMPAWKLGLADRGVLRPGAMADLAVFDLWGLSAPSDYADPHHYSEGMVHVLVAGEFVLRHGQLTDARPGRVVRRPTR